MAGPNWSDDDPADARRINDNCRAALSAVRQGGQERRAFDAADICSWHATMYAGCAVPSPAYVGRFRGDRMAADLIDYEVGIGPTLDDGYPERVGVWADEVAAAVDEFVSSSRRAFILLDEQIPVGKRPHSVDLLHEVVALTAEVHGEWVRIHPFVNGNGRTARLLAAHVALRYGLPVFVALRPRPHDVAYARAAKNSMGRPPGFVGDHREAVAVFAHLLSLQLLGS